MSDHENYRNEIKAYIVRAGMTMSEVVEILADEYGWSSSVPNLSGKLKRGSLRYGEAVELADVLGTFLSDIVLQVLSFVAENERTNIRQRQAEGIAAAKAKGIRFGRPPKPLPENFHSVYQRWKMGEITGTAAAKECGMPLATFRYRAEIYEKAKLL